MQPEHPAFVEYPASRPWFRALDSSLPNHLHHPFAFRPRTANDAKNMTLQDLPALNASLNATAALFMSAGYLFIRARRIPAHRACMLGAVIVSAAFLVSYVTYHVQKPEPTRFGGTGAIRTVYFAMLVSHIILAMAVVPLVLRTVYLALRGQVEKHRAWARWTFPIWYYVSVTGVLVYFFLYRWWPTP
jgi:putative membrane protein